MTTYKTVLTAQLPMPKAEQKQNVRNYFDYMYFENMINDIVNIVIQVATNYEALLQGVSKKIFESLYGNKDLIANKL